MVELHKNILRETGMKITGINYKELKNKEMMGMGGVQ
jgi:hypothetical protein